MNRFPDIDPYDVLGLSRGCSATEIKAAYKKLALKNHPDRAPAAEKEDATARFKIVGEAYEILSDDRKRREYDAFGPGSSTGTSYAPGPEYEDDLSRKHFGTSPNGVPFSFMWESSADSARRAQAGRRAGRPFGADGFDPFELFNMMFTNEFNPMGAMNGGGMGGGRSRMADPFGPSGMMNSGHPMGGGSPFGDRDPFLQNHRMMADTLGFGFGAPFAPPRATSARSPYATQSTGPFGTGFSSSSNFTSTSTSYGGFGGTSQTTTTRTVNGQTETTTRTVDQNGNVTVHSSTPRGNTTTVNGVLQALHPTLGNAAPFGSNVLRDSANGRAANSAGTADDPIVVDSESATPTPMSSNSGSGEYGSSRFNF